MIFVCIPDWLELDMTEKAFLQKLTVNFLPAVELVVLLSTNTPLDYIFQKIVLLNIHKEIRLAILDEFFGFLYIILFVFVQERKFSFHHGVHYHRKRPSVVNKCLIRSPGQQEGINFMLCDIRVKIFPIPFIISYFIRHFSHLHNQLHVLVYLLELSRKDENSGGGQVQMSQFVRLKMHKGSDDMEGDIFHFGVS